MAARPVLPVPGSDPRLASRQTQTALDQIGNRIGSLSCADIAYTPGDAADWVAPAPTTLDAALDRLAAAGGVTPVP